MLGVEVSFMEAVNGTARTVNYTKSEPCSSCKGKRGSNYAVCSRCNGTGMKVVRKKGYAVASTCINCQGGGRVRKSDCRFLW